jgi:NADH-quinone oxidoreductase subunit L
MFHLFTHAFFKALLFLGSGCVIHAMSDEQDMRKMGGIWKHIPVTYTYMWIGSLALAGVGIPGVFGFAGFYSKDVILESSWAANSGVGYYAFWLGIAAAFMTAFYSWRLLFMTFHGKTRADERVFAHVHESPKIMTVPLAVLAIGAIVAGFVGHDAFIGNGYGAFWGESLKVLPTHTALAEAHHVPLIIKLLPLFMGAGGIWLAYRMYIQFPGMADRWMSYHKELHAFSLNKWYFDELYDRIFIRPAFWLGNLFWKKGDGTIIDGFGPDGIAAVTRRVAGRMSWLQSGYVYHYAFAMMIGVVLLVTWYLALGPAG